MSMQVLCSVDDVCGGWPESVVVAGSCYGHDVLLECQTAVKHDTERLHLISHREIDASYRSDTDDMA